MDAKEALKIISALADGRDPADGKPLAGENPCQQPQAIRALFVAATELERRSRRGARAGMPWTDDEDERLATAYESGASIKELAREHSRTATAIQRRLEMLGKLPVTTAGVPPAASSRPDPTRSATAAIAS